MATSVEDRVPLGGPVSRKEARRLLRQITIGVGAMLLAAVDDWNTLSVRHSARLRNVLQSLGRGTYVAALTAAGTEVWLGTHGMHPPGHAAFKQQTAWPAVTSRSKTYMEIHHNEAEPTNDRREAFCTQVSDPLGLVGNPTHCELTWDYDAYTATHIRHIWVSAPGVDWDRFEVSMAKVQAQYTTWSKRRVKWLPGLLPTDSAQVALLPPREERPRLKPQIDVRPRHGEDTRNAE